MASAQCSLVLLACFTARIISGGPFPPSGMGNSLPMGSMGRSAFRSPRPFRPEMQQDSFGGPRSFGAMIGPVSPPPDSPFGRVGMSRGMSRVGPISPPPEFRGFGSRRSRRRDMYTPTRFGRYDTSFGFPGRPGGGSPVGLSRGMSRVGPITPPPEFRGFRSRRSRRRDMYTPTRFGRYDTSFNFPGRPGRSPVGLSRGMARVGPISDPPEFRGFRSRRSRRRDMYTPTRFGRYDTSFNFPGRPGGSPVGLSRGMASVGPISDPPEFRGFRSRRSRRRGMDSPTSFGRYDTRINFPGRPGGLDMSSPSGSRMGAAYRRPSPFPYEPRSLARTPGIFSPRGRAAPPIGRRAFNQDNRNRMASPSNVFNSVPPLRPSPPLGFGMRGPMNNNPLDNRHGRPPFGISLDSNSAVTHTVNDVPGLISHPSASRMPSNSLNELNIGLNGPSVGVGTVVTAALSDTSSRPADIADNVLSAERNPISANGLSNYNNIINNNNAAQGFGAAQFNGMLTRGSGFGGRGNSALANSFIMEEMMDMLP